MVANIDAYVLSEAQYHWNHCLQTPPYGVVSALLIIKAAGKCSRVTI